MEWKVSRERISIFPHPNADGLELAKVGSYQLVVGKGLYKDGDEVIFIPERSILPKDTSFWQEFGHMLAGPDKDRVQMVTLRGAQSYGITWPVRGAKEYPADGSLLYPPLVRGDDGLPLAVQPPPAATHQVSWDFGFGAIGEDISDILTITKHEPAIPAELLASCEKRESYRMHQAHDCVPYGVYTDEFAEGEPVVVTEKIHGSQVDTTYDRALDKFYVSSKSFKTDYAFKEDADNVYTKAAKRVDLLNRIKAAYPDAEVVQVTGEAYPGQKGNWKYGSVDKAGQPVATLKVFKVRVDGETLSYDDVHPLLQELWAPVLYNGPYLPPVFVESYVYSMTDPTTGLEAVDREADGNIIEMRNRFSYPMFAFAEGKEQVSGKETHIREGGVITPKTLRRAKDGTWLQLKMINPKYKPTGEETN